MLPAASSPDLRPRYAVATDAQGRLRAPAGLFPQLETVPATPGDVLILWATGLGGADPPVPAGYAVPADTTHHVTRTVTVTIGGVQALVYGAALAPSFASLYQIGVQVPAGLPGGSHVMTLEVDGVSSPPASLVVVSSPPPVQPPTDPDPEEPYY